MKLQNTALSAEIIIRKPVNHRYEPIYLISDTRKRNGHWGTYIEDPSDILRLKKLRPRCIVVAAKIQEVRQDLRGECTLLRPFLRRLLQAVATHTTNLPVFKLVVMSANEARILPLAFPHRTKLQIQTGGKLGLPSSPLLSSPLIP